MTKQRNRRIRRANNEPRKPNMKIWEKIRESKILEYQKGSPKRECQWTPTDELVFLRNRVSVMAPESDFF